MPIRITEEEAAFLERVEALANEGKTQDQIAEALDVPKHVLRYRLAKRGWSLSSAPVVLFAATGERLSDLRSRGEIVIIPSSEQPSELAESLADATREKAAA